MTDDERSSQLSAMFDGELPPAECELLARRLARDESLRRQWGSYALIGAAVRGEPIAARGVNGVRADLAARVRAASAETPQGATAQVDADAAADATAAAAGTRRQPRLPRWAVPLSGVGLAAGVAAAALLWLRTDAPTSAAVANVVPTVRSAVIPEVVIPMPLPAAAPEAPPATTDSYTVPPPTTTGGPALAGSATLANFLVAHSEVSMPMLRRNALSTVVAVPVEPEGQLAVSAVPSPATPDPTGAAVERP